MEDYGRADLLQVHLGLTPEVSSKIAAIITFAGAIEYFLERALWRLHGIDPKGIKPDTDAKQISDLIGMLATYGAELTTDDHRAFVATWCSAAKSGFVVRHNIAHGVPMKMGDTLAYMRNPRWQGEIRKRDFGDFWADVHALDLVRDGPHVHAQFQELRAVGRYSFITSCEGLVGFRQGHLPQCGKSFLGFAGFINKHEAGQVRHNAL